MRTQAVTHRWASLRRSKRTSLFGIKCPFTNIQSRGDGKEKHKTQCDRLKTNTEQQDKVQKSELGSDFLLLYRFGISFKGSKAAIQQAFQTIEPPSRSREELGRAFKTKSAQMQLTLLVQAFKSPSLKNGKAISGEITRQDMKTRLNVAWADVCLL